MRTGWTAGIMVVTMSGMVMAAGPGQGQETKAFRQGQKEKKKAFVQQRKQENKAFKESMKGKPKEEKKAAVKEHRIVQQAGKKSFTEKMHQDNMAFLKERLAKNTTLSTAQKNELINHFDKQYKEKTSFRGAQHKERVEFLEKIAADARMTQEQKKAALRDFISQQKTGHAASPAVKEGEKTAPAEVPPQQVPTTEIPANIQPQPAPAAKPADGSDADYHAIEPSTVRQSF